MIMLSFSRSISRAGRETEELERTVAAGASSLVGAVALVGKGGTGARRGEEAGGPGLCGSVPGAPWRTEN